MAEYIKREALLKDIDENIIFSARHGDAMLNREIRGASKVINRILDAPTADVVEVVRCKKCKHHHWEQEPCHGKTEHFCSVLDAQVFKDFYCYFGEAKMDGKVLPHKFLGKSQDGEYGVEILE